VAAKIVAFKYQLALGMISLKKNKINSETNNVQQISDRDDAISQQLLTDV
jgi:hypothetical protein